MNNHDKYLLCLERAKAIVAAHRAEAPEDATRSTHPPP